MLRVKRAVQARFTDHIQHFVPSSATETVAPAPAYPLPAEKNIDELPLDI